ncbi:hypothetical protein ACIA5G_19530 [Amycolatopsis sp. NPDC051758]|uniref:hypothetical protein n=1 Tax=Amycolatopsis sp. NPDC051758 TaxID=3363935 RepID=UPI0037B751DD
MDRGPPAPAGHDPKAALGFVEGPHPLLGGLCLPKTTAGGRVVPLDRGTIALLNRLRFAQQRKTANLVRRTGYDRGQKICRSGGSYSRQDGAEQGPRASFAEAHPMAGLTAAHLGLKDQQSPPTATLKSRETVGGLCLSTVRHQGLEPRTRWLRERVLGCQAVPSDVGQDLFSGTSVPDSAELFVQVVRGSWRGRRGRVVAVLSPSEGRDPVLAAVTMIVAV